MEFLKRFFGSERVKVPLEPTDVIVYFDRRIWISRDPETGQEITTVDKIRQLLHDPEITADNIKIVNPELHPSFNPLNDYFKEQVKEGKIPRALVIPQRAKADSTSGTIWLTIDPNYFLKPCMKLGVPLYQIGVGQLWPPEVPVIELNK